VSFANLQREVEAEERMETLLGTIAISLLIGTGIWAAYGFEKAAEYFTGYIVEQSLSIDNLFVFILIFEYFRTPKEYEGKVSCKPSFVSVGQQRLMRQWLPNLYI
jgi:tellurite resistance protein TerC